ncbi:S41 family peptidase [Sphingomonas hankyongi]|uniref:S41 family peptidase n=1 Tax=Sphingomonas hankyongi TaxID=2908209 RepID=A0ABT0S1F4_9SPHN|nr:S41 family peptidase [Sphingomonas hankyongi]MCL6729684.1 S41 family peptidase [Sphingomonas hankyongi]
MRVRPGFARPLLIGLAVALAAPAFGAASAPPAPSTYDELERFMSVFERVKKNYVKPVDDHTLINGAIDGMLAALDPHSSYAEGQDFENLQTIADGNYGGLGLVTTIEDGLLKVVSTTEDTPAWRAGIKSGDYITHINGELMFGSTLDESVNKMRGEPGTKVELRIRREGNPKPIELSLVRGVIDVNPVKWEVRNRVGIINLNIFNGKSGQATREAIQKINAATNNNAVGYVLDLRSNGGGIVDEAVEIADMFLDQGEIVSQRGRSNDTIRRFYAHPGDLTNGKPLIVLVDAGSASASEIVAGALQDHHRGLVIGELSFGKGSVQSVFRMGADRALKLTTDLYYLPSGKSVQGGGIDPDIVVPQLSDEGRVSRLKVRESDLKRHLITEAGDEDALLKREDPPSARFTVTAADLKKKGIDDYQLDYAIKVLQRVSPVNIASEPHRGSERTTS